MSKPLSQNTKAILLLTAPLIVGRGRPGGSAPRPLSLKREYSELANRLREIGREPAHLIGGDGSAVLDECLAADGPRVDQKRIEALLGRGVQLSLAVERWQTRAIWVVSRADRDYPRRLKARLREKAPPVLYGCGDRSLADKGGLAVVGPREVGTDLIGYAQEVGALAAGSGRVVVSGAARGIDRAAMDGALAAGGWAVGVLVNNLARASTHRENRNALLDGRLVLVSPYDPAARFLAGHAMERNHSVYSLADAALVVEALVGSGGTWAGATAQLGRPSPSPVYVRSTLSRSEGLVELEARGALPWPNPQSPEVLAEVLRAVPAADLAAVGTEAPAAPPYATAAVESEAPRGSSAGSGSNAGDRMPSGPEQRLLGY